MKNKLIILLFILALGCSSDDSSRSVTDLKLVTGINCRQNAEDIPLQLGNPNIFNNNKFTAYPNPVNEVVNLASAENITDVWVMPAKAEKIFQDEDFTGVFNSSLYTEQQLSTQSAFELNGQSSTGIMVDIGALPKGYYKVFVKINGAIYWDNLYKIANGGDNEAELNALSDFWD